MENSIAKILYNEEQIKTRVKEMAQEITKDLMGDDLIVLTVLKGGAMLSADLVRCFDFPVTLDYIAVSSYYSGTVSTGNVQIKKDTDININGKRVLIVEDIVDSGNTLAHLKELFKLRGAKDVKICTLLNKPARRVAEIKVDYIGFEIPDEFVVGYGLDYNQLYRNLPYIGVLKPEVYA
ncbi:MAG: hypoxanthine phosphoribosyltransferase [Clostridia bacterium]|nr:hypoxanthine phosphoribosyltransferase [Clostridia bacterium]